MPEYHSFSLYCSLSFTPHLFQSLSLHFSPIALNSISLSLARFLPFSLSFSFSLSHSFSLTFSITFSDSLFSLSLSVSLVVSLTESFILFQTANLLSYPFYMAHSFQPYLILGLSRSVPSFYSYLLLLSLCPTLKYSIGK